MLEPKIPLQTRKSAALTSQVNAQMAYARARTLNLQMARLDPSVFMRVVLKDERNGKPIEQAPLHDEWQRFVTEQSRTVIWSHVEGGKGLAARTPIPTPSGWTTMGALRAGDTIFGGDGKPCTVTFVTPLQHGRACFLFVWDDGSSLVADDVHRWKAQTITDAVRARGRLTPSAAHTGEGVVCACGCGCGLHARVGKRFVHNHHTRRSGAWRVADTAEILRQGLTRVGGGGPQYLWRMPLGGSVQYAAQPLPIDPYWLGAWLGDGDSCGAALTMHREDYEALPRLERDVGPADVVPDPRHPHVLHLRFRGPRADGGGLLRTRLRHLGLINDKHIPAVYLSADEAQRWELLRGLLDTDGTVKANGAVLFDNMNERLADGVLSLVRSLGMKATRRSKIARSPVDGRELGPVFTIEFRADVPAFYLARKAERQIPARQHSRARYRPLVAVERVGSEPTLCIAVDSHDHTYLAGEGYVVTHNTTQLPIGRSLYELGLNPNLRIAIVSNTAEQAKKIVRTIGQYIEKSGDLRAVFPELRKSPDRSMPWNSTALTVAREVFAKEPSVQACGVHGNIMGSRIDRLFLDDILDYENTRTKTPRDDLWGWIQSTLFGRLTDDARVCFVGNAYNPDDAMHHAAALPRYVSRRYPVITQTGTLTWPSKWPKQRIEDARLDLGPLEYARQLLCQSRDESEARFKREWIDVAITRGRNFDEVRRLAVIPNGYAIFTGVDLAVQQHSAADLTVFFTILLWPDGTRQVLNIESGRWSGPEIIGRLDDVHERYGGIVMVENVGAQDYILQFARTQSRAVVKHFTTGRNKADPAFGVESIAAEIAGGKWVIPNKVAAGGKSVLSKDVDAWIAEMLYYNPKDHTGDRLMACWFAREAARAFERGQHRTGARVEARVIGVDKGARPPAGAPAALRGATRGLRLVSGG